MVNDNRDVLKRAQTALHREDSGRAECVLCGSRMFQSERGWECTGCAEINSLREENMIEPIEIDRNCAWRDRFGARWHFAYGGWVRTPKGAEASVFGLKPSQRFGPFSAAQ